MNSKKFKEEDVLIPRLPMTPTNMAFPFNRLQFPIQLSFAIMINKFQGQSLQVCGIWRIHVFLMDNYMLHSPV